MAEEEYGAANGNGQYEQTYEEQPVVDAGAGDAATPGDRINASKNDDDDR